VPDTFDRLKAALADCYAIDRNWGSGGMAPVPAGQGPAPRRSVRP